MLRTLLRSHHLQLNSVRPQHRYLVSSVLLTRSYENESVAELKKLAKDRGLSQKGNKPTLIARIQTHDQQKTLEAVSAQEPPLQAGAQVRHASLAAPTASKSGSSGSTPGIPPAGKLRNNVDPSNIFTNVVLPDLSQPDPEIPTPIPFLPDFYDSIHHPNPYKSADFIPPQVLVVAGSSTHHGGGPTHHASDAPESLDRYEHDVYSSASLVSSGSSATGLWKDVAEDLGLPTSWKREQLTDGQKVMLDSLSMKTGASNEREKDYSRKLDKDEVRGVWVLVGLLAGSWVLGGLFNRPPKDKAKLHALE